MKLIVENIGLDPHQVEKGSSQLDMWTEIEYWIKIQVDGKWYINKDKSYQLDEALVKRDEELDRISGSRG